MKVKLAIGAAITTLGVLVATVVAQNAGNAGMQTLRFDVSENMAKFVFDEKPVFSDGMPGHGNEFITQGYLYPYGMLKSGEDGVNKDGSPKYPDKVIGEWTCKGWFVGEGAHAKTGPMVITTQIYDFGKEHGKKTLITEGYELADIGKAVARAITGGTGEYATASGEAQQTFLGFNATEGVNLRFELKVKK